MYGSYYGSFSLPALPTEEVIGYVQNVKKDVEKTAKRQFPEYRPVLFSLQTNPEEIEYHVKVQTGDFEYIQVRLAAVLNIPLFFNGLLDHRTIDDPIRPYHQLMGGLTDVQLATSDINQKANELKDQLERDIRTNFEEFKAVLFRRQVVAGTNYMVKVHTGGEVYLHMMMFEGLPISPILKKYEYPKTREDPLVV